MTKMHSGRVWLETVQSVSVLKHQKGLARVLEGGYQWARTSEADSEKLEWGRMLLLAVHSLQEPSAKVWNTSLLQLSRVFQSVILIVFLGSEADHVADSWNVSRLIAKLLAWDDVPCVGSLLLLDHPKLGLFRSALLPVPQSDGSCTLAYVQTDCFTSGQHTRKIFKLGLACCTLFHHCWPQWGPWSNFQRYCIL